MSSVAGFPYFEIEFDKKGAACDPDEVTSLKGGLAGNSDLLVLAHGWNNDMDEARSLYASLLARIRERADAAPAALGGRSIAVMAVLWPSKKFADQELIPGGAAALGTDDEAINQLLDHLETVFDDPPGLAAISTARGLVSQLTQGAGARREFADTIRTLVDGSGAESEDGSDAFLGLDGDDLMARLNAPFVGGAPSPGTGGAAGLGDGQLELPAAGLGDLFGGFLSAARKLLNFTTYFEMKQRAGAIGESGVNSLLREIRDQYPGVKVHVAGHSFGARLATAAICGASSASAFNARSLILLQAAFSHYGFARCYDGASDGKFRRLVTASLVSGPTVITYTKNDRAVGIAYPIASQIAGQIAAAIGDKHDPYGGLGRNGAQKTPEAIDETLLPASAAYALTGGVLHNLNADDYISDHSDICGPEVAHAIVSAIAST